MNKCTKKQIVNICKYILYYSRNLWLNVSVIHEGMHSILEAMVGRLWDEMDSTRMPLSFWASRLNLLAILIWSSNLLFKLERKILDLIETQAICHLWDWNTDLRCCRDWNFEWYQSLGEFGSLAKDAKDNQNMSSKTFGKLNTTQIIMKHFSSLTKCILVI